MSVVKLMKIFFAFGFVFGLVGTILYILIGEYNRLTIPVCCTAICLYRLLEVKE